MSVYLYLDGVDQRVDDLFQHEGALVALLERGDSWYVFLSEEDAKYWLTALVSAEADKDKEGFLDYVGTQTNYDALKSCMSLTTLIDLMVTKYYNEHIVGNASKWSEVYKFQFILPYPVELWP